MSLSDEADVSKGTAMTHEKFYHHNVNLFSC